MKLPFLMTFSFICLVSLSGCVSLATLQTAQPLDPGKVNIDLGAAVHATNSFAFIPEAGARVGLFTNADLGAKVSLGGLFFVDAKYQFIDSPIRVSGDLGWSYSESSNIASIGWYPTVLIGQDHWYAGIRETHLSSSGEIDLAGTQKISASKWFLTDFVVGASLGDQLRILPELNFIFPTNGKALIMEGIGFQFNYW